MSTILNIVIRDDAGTALSTIELNANGNTLLTYPLLSPEQRSVESQSLLSNGMTIGKTLLSDVTEPVTVLAVRDTDAALVALRQSIENAFLVAARRQERKRGPRVFVEFQLDRLAVMFRSEIKRGRLVSDAADIDVGWRTRAMQLDLVWLRNYCWDSTTLTPLALRSKATAKTTSPVSIANTTDGTYGNWIEILGSDLPGVLPLPIKLQLSNSYGSGTPLLVYAGLNIDSDPTALNPVLESDAATWFGTQSTLTAGTYSNGSAKEVSWAGSSDSLVAEWTLSSSLLTQLNGAWCQIIGRFPTGANNIYMHLEVRYSTVRTLAVTEPVLGTADIFQRLGALQLPPRLIGATLPTLTLRLYVRKTGGGTLQTDCLHLLVSDGYTEYKANGFGLSGSIIDNPYDTTISPMHFVKEPLDGLLLRPGADQRMSFIQSGNGDEIARTMTVQAWYRERRLTL